MAAEYPDIVRQLATEMAIDDKLKESLKKAAGEFKNRFVAATEA
jgi:uncharacterized protein YutE (UPF0331/DUF86 family)